ncbi:MAG: GNAT family N-acetyltransferase [Microcoleus sp. PH2017_10_PVI_O_A]|uniref:GNAT family N-acetyltransferase n=1 Tax=unclassified Microcoleus TaxID=2642155 RepID=UPI001D307E35|nr:MULTISPECIES: GNAT family N-acetyltransferase [unclassified Microcoleus]TAE81285.1 MAG: GNAT family N-acetyltransferase [Oscillatoriales cyanobacterium]MCC3405441.1 GNAT family N-acetyltransferase [Microcoleus sp. PH2017_10_PVI_O_A]MCC3459434.1 GNAT family N-acetyltransferase [Microcoleus sp. PH2017_11_PCY_U_A]MCC3477714.1 GNAT family N-acetyltransferase [Microcoleus sp. PH2017_12_PCY_D_A]MCC3527436.1 GNAT family N-acetyltransferase [Microcoleus sp. PH2017_21_RUC_O_A]
MTVNYRVAAIADMTLLLELVKEFHKKEQLEFDEKVDRDVLANLLADASLGKVWLIQQEDEAIGYIILTLGYSLEYRGRDAFIDEFYIRPNYRGQGIGTQTLAFAEDTCRVLGVQALHLEVDFENPDAQRLYHRVGYQSHNRFLMTKNLAVSEDKDLGN